MKLVTAIVVAPLIRGRIPTVVPRVTTLVTPGENVGVLVTDHEAFNYFADAYGFTIAGVVIPGGSTDAAASSRATTTSSR